MDQCTPLPPQHRLVKSRSGCSTCKSRKVKCDEVRPVCGNCAKRYIGLTHCEYRSPPAPRRNAARPSMPAALTARPATIADEPASRRLELRLMYHYVRTVCLELPDCNGTPAGDLWQDRVPTLAFESEVVLDTVLAISALHLQSLSHNTQELITASTRYLNRALTRHRRILATNDKKTAESLLVSAILISNIAWLQAHRRVRGEAYDLPMHAYNMIQGVSALFLWKKSWFEEAGYGWFGQEEPLAVDEHLQQSSPFLLDVQQDLDLLARGFRIGECRDYAVYDQAMKYILWLYTAVLSRKSAGHLHRFVGTMPLRLDARFIVLLKAYDPLCMALLARGIAVLKLIDYAWWIHGRDDYEVLEFDIDGICKLMPADCRWAMDWPLKVASGVINV